MNPAFWSGRNVLVTGHTGFKGSWLTLMLRSFGANVTGLALDPVEGAPALFNMANVESECRSIIGDIRDIEVVRRTVAETRPTIVLHLAAQALVRPSYEDPIGTYATNVMGTAHVLDAIRFVDSVETVVVVTSDKCYENREWPWGYRETDAMGGHDPYSSSKGCTELVASAYAQSYFHKEGAPKLATGRAGNVIGGGDYAKDRLIPDLLRSFIEGIPAEIRNPAATRPWQHVIEPLVGYLTLAERLNQEGKPFEGGWNFGPDPDSVRPVSQVADLMVQKWGGSASWALAQGAKPHEAQSLSLDCSKSRIQLKWRPKLNFDAALEWTVRWTKATQDGTPAREACLSQINEYLALGTPSLPTA